MSCELWNYFSVVEEAIMITHGHERIKHHGVTVAQKQLAHPHIGGSFSPRPCMSKCLQAKTLNLRLPLICYHQCVTVCWWVGKGQLVLWSLVSVWAWMGECDVVRNTGKERENNQSILLLSHYVTLCDWLGYYRDRCLYSWGINPCTKLKLDKLSVWYCM